MPDYTINVVEDAIKVLLICLNAEGRYTLAEITKRTGLGKNKVFRILSTLEKHRFVERDETGAYHLGIRFLSFGEHVRSQMDLLQASRPVMDRLAAETDESIFLGVIDGQEALCVDARESQHSIRLFARVDGVPKVLLAYLPDEEREALLEAIELQPFTPQTITNRRLLEQQLRQIRDQGYIVSADDLDLGAHSVAAPIWNYSGRVVAALSIAGPSSRFTAECIRQYVELVRKGAAEVSRKLGYQDRESFAAL